MNYLKIKSNYKNKNIFLFVIYYALTIYSNQFTISESDLVNKIKGGWLGKIAGVCIGEPTEFKAKNKMYKGKLNFYPHFKNGFKQDDLYGQLIFIHVMDEKIDGPNGIFTATMKDYGNALKNAPFPFWYNMVGAAARKNLKDGLYPPLSGRCAGNDNPFIFSDDPEFNCYNKHANNLDWQISCDWIGLMCPLMPMTAVQLSDSVGHVMCYADGLYGGHFVSAMITIAFKYNYNTKTITNTLHEIINSALLTIPKESQYYEIVNYIITFKSRYPDKDYTECWHSVNEKYLLFTADNNIFDTINFSAALNGAFIVIGLLYGNGDIMDTIEYTIRCGQDSDCNPANAGAVLGTLIGYDRLPKKWKQELERNTKARFSYSKYSYSDLIKSSIERAEKTIHQFGGYKSGKNFVINEQKPSAPSVMEVYMGKPKINN